MLVRSVELSGVRPLTVANVNAGFSVGARVQTTSALNVRSKANMNSGKILCTQPAGSMGTIISGPTSSQGFTWWNVNFDTSCDGWSVQTYLQAI